MYELMYEWMMKVPLFVNLFSQKWMMYVWLDCIKLISIDPNLLLFLDLWNPSVLIFFSLKNILWSNQFIEKLFSVSLLFEHYLSDIHEIAKSLGRD